MIRVVMMAALLAAPLCLAQPVYRCQGAAGVTYQDEPCAGRGELLVLQSYRPAPGEVARSERRREAVRRFLGSARLRRLEATREMTPLPALPEAEAVSEPRRQRVRVILLLSPGRHHPARFPRHRAGRHRPGVVVCPLGLVNCKKVWRPPAFRAGAPRPAYRPAAGPDRRHRMD